MSSLFDTLVYQRLTLSVRYRHSVASRFWWEIEWTRHDGEKFSVSAQELDLCLWRAAVIDEGDQKMTDWLTKTKLDYLRYQRRRGTADDTIPIAEGITNEIVDKLFTEIEALRIQTAEKDKRIADLEALCVDSEEAP